MACDERTWCTYVTVILITLPHVVTLQPHRMIPPTAPMQLPPTRAGLPRKTMHCTQIRVSTMKASFTAVTFNKFARSLGSSVIPWVLNISPEAQAIISRSKVNPKLDIKDWLKRTAKHHRVQAQHHGPGCCRSAWHDFPASSLALHTAQTWPRMVRRELL